MLIKVNSAAPLGLDSLGIIVEINIASRGFPSFDIVGLPNKATTESRHRIKTALINLNLDFPSRKRITVNLAPADVPKQGSFYDLPIAVGILSIVHKLKLPQKSLFFGELSLDGTLRHTKGALVLALFARDAGFKNLFVPESNFAEVSVIPELKVFPVKNLTFLYKYLKFGDKSLQERTSSPEFSSNNFSFDFDMHDIVGQEKIKRALEISAAGGHNVLMLGPPGSGKTVLSKAFRSILPPLSREEALEITKIYSAAGSIPPGGALISQRPFRAPHHTTTHAGILGGGSVPKPGEISLAHRGVLFLDEFLEFPRPILEMLRQPLEESSITISRNYRSFNFPCSFILLAAANPCPCGFYGTSNICSCTPGQIRRYRKKLSGPILDRIDLFCSLDAVKAEKLNLLDKPSSRETSKEIRSRVIEARKIQAKRFKEVHILTNSEMTNKHIKNYCKVNSDTKQLLEKATDTFGLSARSYFRVLKVSRTIADLGKSPQIKEKHLAEALQYRYRY